MDSVEDVLLFELYMDVLPTCIFAYLSKTALHGQQPCLHH